MKEIGVYILKGTRYYIGSTHDLAHRLQEHASGNTHTTKRIGQWELLEKVKAYEAEQTRKLDEAKK